MSKPSMSKKRKAENDASDKQFIWKRKRQETSEHSNLNTLPDEVLLAIMKFLPLTAMVKLSHVSKRLCRVTKHPKLWGHVQADMWNIQGNMNLVSMVWPHHEHITSITLQCSDDSNKGTSNVVCTQIEVDKQFLFKLADRLRQLHHVRIEGAILTSTLIADLHPPLVKTLELIRCFMVIVGYQHVDYQQIIYLKSIWDNLHSPPSYNSIQSYIL